MKTTKHLILELVFSPQIVLQRGMTGEVWNWKTFPIVGSQVKFPNLQSFHSIYISEEKNG